MSTARYVVAPATGGYVERGFHTLDAAKDFARREAKRDGHAREVCDLRGPDGGPVAVFCTNED